MAPDAPVPTSAGLTSFNLLEESQLFAGLGLQPGMQVLDFGCGVGNYAIAAAPYLGDEGCIYAVDLWDDGLETLEIRSAMAGLDNISSQVGGAGETLLIDDKIVDLCLLATVVHILVLENQLPETLNEIKRVMKPRGKVAVIEFYKQEGPPGPPLEWRLSPDDLTEIMASHGFGLVQTSTVGPYNYLSLFNQER